MTQLRNALVLMVQREQTDRFERSLRHNPKLAEREEEIRGRIARSGIRATAKVIGCARTLWRFAMSQGYVSRNIAADVKKPKADNRVDSQVVEQFILSPGEVERMVASAAEQHRCAIDFLFASGVRFGEMLGLMWSDFDWASSRVLVQRQRSAMTGELTTPKTQSGVRWIPLAPEMISALRAHKLRTPGEFAFRLDARNFRAPVWHPTLRRAGLRGIRIHDARHTFASHAIAAGIDVVEVSHLLGHADPAITLKTYSHAFARRQSSDAGARLAEFRRREAAGCVLVVPSTSAELSARKSLCPFGLMGNTVFRTHR